MIPLVLKAKPPPGVARSVAESRDRVLDVERCYGLNGHRAYFVMALSLVTYEHAISKSRRFTALFSWTPGPKVEDAPQIS